jgi:D-alanyl-lipoteichoic acid acyltransferase DltB (MBOAT superfamily)
MREYARVIVFICVFGVGVWIWLRFEYVLVGMLCNLWKIVRQLGSRSLVISWLQMSGMGL